METMSTYSSSTSEPVPFRHSPARSLAESVVAVHRFIMKTRTYFPLICLILAACTGDAMCTLLACFTGTTVHLTAKPLASFKVEVFANGTTSGSAYVFDCPNPIQCGQDIGFPGLIAERLTVRVTIGTATRTTEIPSVTYSTSSPNGRKCGDCQQATVTADPPA